MIGLRERHTRRSLRSRMPEKAAAPVRAPAPVVVTPKRGPKPKAKPREYRAFTARIPVALYDRLVREAVVEERSVTAQLQVNLEEFYAAVDEMDA